MPNTQIYHEPKEHDLTNAEIKALYTIGRGFTTKEKLEVVKTFSTDILINEINRRNNIIENRYAALVGELGNVTENSTHQEVSEILKKCHNILGGCDA